MDEKELAELDLAVAKAEGLDTFGVGDQLCAVFMRAPNGTALKYGPYQPTRDPAEAMRLLEKYNFNLLSPMSTGEEWNVIDGQMVEYQSSGPNPAIAICRAVVALKQRQE
jgi:hypothetical protein